MSSILSDTKHVRIMTDHCSTGIWNKYGGSSDGSELPVTPDVLKRLDAWQGNYDRADCFVEPTEEWSYNHMREGYQIAIEIKKQLPDWTVVLYNESPDLFNLQMDTRNNATITTEMVNKAVTARAELLENLNIALDLTEVLHTHLNKWGEIMEEARVEKIKKKVENLITKKEVTSISTVSQLDCKLLER